MIIVVAAAAAEINNGSGFLGEHSERLVAWILSVLIKSLFNCPQKKKLFNWLQLQLDSFCALDLIGKCNQ